MGSKQQNLYRSTVANSQYFSNTDVAGASHVSPSTRRQAAAVIPLSDADSAGLNVLRVVACFMVIFLHVAAVGFHDFIPGWWASNVYDSVLRSCVPLFLMITGALLLRKEEGLWSFFTRRFSRVVPPFLFWSFSYLSWRHWQGTLSIEWYRWPLTILEGPTAHHLWYLYALLGIYAAIPFLRKIYLHATLSERYAFLLLWAVASTWQLAESAQEPPSPLVDIYQFSFFAGLIGYVFLGAVIADLLGRLQRQRIGFLLLFILSSALTAISTYALSTSSGVPNTLMYSFQSPFVMAAGISLFVLLTRIGQYFQKTPTKWLQQLSGATLGIYGIHVFVLEILHTRWINGELLPAPWLSIPIFSLVVFIVSAAVILIVRRASWLRGII
ncbi:acyltransferase family protein [Paenalcaligenes niemegkensis]|uniref:acyltransferase n=1 Tax=Paenalcaligenes niemegkensis TaxID=2895469 RepID=UPI001EE81987|nr:acyltransferase family protein [Paenalcaligenes niemegkensis]MCQ9618201.1 acyltransferase family protein [Paenalcaligenes niemegkensis]